MAQRIKGLGANLTVFGNIPEVLDCAQNAIVIVQILCHVCYFAVEVENFFNSVSQSFVIRREVAFERVCEHIQRKQSA